MFATSMPASAVGTSCGDTWTITFFRRVDLPRR
jgi:hypothetical protein